MATVSDNTAGRCAARAIRYPAVAMRPTPHVTAAAPSSTESPSRPHGGGARAISRRATAVAHDRVVALREAADEVVGGGEARCLPDGTDGRRRAPQPDVLEHGRAK